MLNGSRFCILQQPFRKSKGLIQCVCFHPVKPILFVAVSTLFLMNDEDLIRKLISC